MKRSLTLVVLLVLVALIPTSAFAFGKNKIVYDEFEWQIYRSTHFDVYFYEEEKDSLQKVVNFAESAYDDLSRKFNFQISKRIPLIFYATHSAFQQTNVELMFIPEGVGAFAEPVKNRMVLPIDMPDQKLLQLIQHELTHIFEYEILFQGKLGREIRTRPPTWMMEGLASFMAQDEDTRDRMVLRDAVVNDSLPSISRQFGGYFAYRFGHAVFRYMVDRYGWDGLRDFIYEYRNALGPSIEKPLKRAFDVTVEEFDTQFRTWLRKQYLPSLIAKGEPTEYGQRFSTREDARSQELSPAISPSGDLLASCSTERQDVDITIFNVPKRTLMRNISKGYPEEYEYLIIQAMTVGPVMGRDIAFSPTGDHIAVFAKKERGRSLLLLNAFTGEIDRSVAMKVEQQLNPAFSPDGKLLVFHGFSGNRADIWLYDLESGAVRNLTDDEFFDAAPVFSRDGRSIIYASVVDGYSKIFRMDLADPTKRFQITRGAWNDIDPALSPDGKKLYYASDRQTGRDLAEAAALLQGAEESEEAKGPKLDPTNFAAFNIYSLNLESGEILQFTDVVGGCFTPQAFIGEENKERIAFASYYKGRWQLYATPIDNPVRTVETIELPAAPVEPSDRVPFLPPVEVAIDPEDIRPYEGFRLFIENVDVTAGVNSDQTFMGRAIIYMTDMLGDRRFIASLSTVSTFSDFDFLYFDMTKRMNWGVRLFDDRTFYTQYRPELGEIERERQLYRQTGALGLLSYPFDRNHRIDAGAGYMLRDINFFGFKRSDDFPFVTATFSGDSTEFKSFGPISGRRYQITSNYGYDMEDGGTLTNDYTLEFRQYLQLTSRTLLAARLFAGYATGNFSNFYYFGGLDTLRGYDFRSFVGDRAAYANFELRFPLVDILATPLVTFSQIRGTLFFDIGAAYFSEQEDDFTFMENNRLVDGRAALGWGIALNALGLELHWDFAKRTDLKDHEKGFETSFWVGQSF
ncbi:MAG: BamA/TamA family outer membrane protein [Thermoanaerobaculia bacterium]